MLPVRRASSADLHSGQLATPLQRGLPGQACVLTGSRPGGGAYETSQARPGPHWLQAQGVGLMAVTSCALPRLC